VTQLESPFSKTYEGAGVGLVLAKRLVESLGGTILVKSEVGRGSRFTVLIPADMSDGKGYAEPASPKESMTIASEL
jgi:signal transduction histidine kinase